MSYLLNSRHTRKCMRPKKQQTHNTELYVKAMGKCTAGSFFFIYIFVAGRHCRFIFAQTITIQCNYYYYLSNYGMQFPCNFCLESLQFFVFWGKKVEGAFQVAVFFFASLILILIYLAESKDLNKVTPFGFQVAFPIKCIFKLLRKPNHTFKKHTHTQMNGNQKQKKKEQKLKKEMVIE